MKNYNSAHIVLALVCLYVCSGNQADALDVNVPPADINTAIQSVNSSSDDDNNIFITGSISASYDLTQIIKNVVISAEGPSRTAINLDGHSGFWLHGGNTTGMENLVISNGVNPVSSPIAGGAVFVEGTLDMNNMEFLSNTDASGQGGAINNSADSMLRIENSIFTSNSQTETSPYSGGGAINNSAVAYVSNSTFTKNLSRSQGGAIYNNGENSSLESFNNTYGQNTATNEGGAIYSNDGRISSNNDQFHYNTAQMGGAVYYNGSGD